LAPRSAPLTRVAVTAAATVALIAAGTITIPAAATPDPGESRIQSTQTATPETFTFTAALRYDRRELRRIAQLVSTPGRGQYRAFRTLAEASAELGATRAQRRALRAVARTLGLDVQFSATGLTADLTGPTAVWNELYGTTPLALSTTPWTSFVYVNAQGNPLPTPVELEDVVREVIPSQSILDPTIDPGFAAARVTDPIRASADDTASPPVNEGTPFGPGFDCLLPEASNFTYSPSQLQVPYGAAALHDSGLRGAGTRIVNLAGSYAFSQEYADHAADCFAYDSPTIRFTGGPNVGPQPVTTAGDDEGNLDVQTIAAVIPEAAGFDFLQVSINPILYLSFVQAVDTMVTTLSPLPDIATMSFGACEPDLVNNPLRAISEDHFAYAGILGVSMLAAAGDGGSSDCSQFVPDPPVATRLNAVQYPASSQWVTGVGGTRITLGEGNERVSEVVWNDSPWGQIDGGTGGPSLYQRPWYQKSITARDRRLVPDIAAHASNYHHSFDPLHPRTR